MRNFTLLLIAAFMCSLSFGQIKIYTGGSASIGTNLVVPPSNSSIVVGNNSALFINAEEITINGEFEVQLGSVFNVDIVPECN